MQITSAGRALFSFHGSMYTVVLEPSILKLAWPNHLIFSFTKDSTSIFSLRQMKVGPVKGPRWLFGRLSHIHQDWKTSFILSTGQLNCNSIRSSTVSIHLYHFA